MLPMNFDRSSLELGVQLMSPIIPSIVLFGLIFGYTGGNADLPILLVSSTSFIIFAGTAQFFIILAIIEKDPLITVVLTAIVINLRHLLYGAALHDDIKVKGFKKLLVSYFLTDEVFIVSSELKKKFANKNLVSDNVDFEDTLIGAGFFAWSVWNLCTILGYLFSDFLEDLFAISSEFIVAGTFLGYLVIRWKDFPSDRLFLLEVMIIGFFLSFLVQSSILLFGILVISAIIAMVEQSRVDLNVRSRDG